MNDSSTWPGPVTSQPFRPPFLCPFYQSRIAGEMGDPREGKASENKNLEQNHMHHDVFPLCFCRKILPLSSAPSLPSSGSRAAWWKLEHGTERAVGHFWAGPRCSFLSVLPTFTQRGALYSVFLFPFFLSPLSHIYLAMSFFPGSDPRPTLDCMYPSLSVHGLFTRGKDREIFLREGRWLKIVPSQSVHTTGGANYLCAEARAALSFSI